MPAVELKLGTAGVRFDCPEHVERLTTAEPRKVITPERFARRLAQQLERLRPDLSRVAVVVGDKTRLCGYPDYLPVLLSVLTDFGARQDRTTVYIAYGTHPAQSAAECRTAYGTLYREAAFVHHDCSDGSLFADQGVTRRGTPIRIRRDILAAGCLVTFGALSHHYFAGYGGGRKLVFPGLGQREAIYRNHALFLDTERRTLAAGCRAGRLDGNPLAEDLFEVEDRRPADLAVHGILDSRGAVCDLLPGIGREHYRSACRAYARGCEIDGSRRFDLVVASCGGHPKDINFIQAHKSIENAARLVADGRELIVLARCPDGVGSKTFLPWFGQGGFLAAFDRLAAGYEGNGGTALSTMAKTARIRISLVTDLPPEVCSAVGVEKISPEQAMARLRAACRPAAVIANASLLVPVEEEMPRVDRPMRHNGCQNSLPTHETESRGSIGGGNTPLNPPSRGD